MRWARRWAVPFAVFVVLAVGAIAISEVFHTVVEDQEARLVSEHADEGASYLASTMGEIADRLRETDSVISAGHDPLDTVRILSGGLPTTIAASTAHGYVVRASTVEGVTAGATVGDLDSTLLRRSAVMRGVVSTMVPKGLLLALASDSAGYLELLPLNPTKPVATPLFRELDGRVYAANVARPSQLVFTSVPLDTSRVGPVRTRHVMIGAMPWVVVISARQPLVGSLATRLPTLLLVAGLLGALLLAGVIRLLMRAQELREARRTAEAANASKSEFLSRMSHELRTPLNAVLGFAQLLQLDDLDERQSEAVQQILRGGRHLLDLINEVLEITRIESGVLSISSEPVDVVQLTREILDLAQPLAASAGITLVDELDGEVYVHADRQRLKQVLLNLTSNAIKYNRPGGSVRLQRRAGNDGAVRIAVIDTGVGIPAEDLDRLFVPFERLGAERAGIEGTGIGLSLSRRLAEAMGGGLGVASVEGEGSTFWVELPPTAPTVAGAAATDDTATARRTLLYIDDNPANVRLVEQAFPDVDVIATDEGACGLKLAVAQQPSLVLLDLHLPDTRGEVVLARLRTDAHTASIPVVVLTADATPGTAERLYSLGAVGCLSKPLDLDALRRLLDEHTLVPS